MGFLENHRRKAEEQRVAADHMRAEQAYRAWYDADQQLSALAEEVRSFDGLDGAADSPVVLKKGERMFLVASGAHLIEPRRGPGHYSGGYQGVSFKVMKGVRYHVGGTRGTFVQGEERPSPIDEGTVTITDQRVVFQGMKQAREWSFAKLLGVQHDPHLPWTAIQVSNRQKVSGFLYDEANAPMVRFRLSLALTHFRGDVKDLQAEVDRQLAEHRSEQPPYPAPLALPATTN